MHFVDGNATALHSIKHLTKGQFHVKVKSGHAVLFQFLCKRRAQVPHCLCAGGSIAVIHGNAKEIGSQFGYGIIRLAGIQIIGRKSGIKSGSAIGNSHIIQPVHHGFTVMENKAVTEGNTHLGFHGGQHTDAIFPCYTQTAVLSKVYSAVFRLFREKIDLRKGGQFFCLFLGCFRCCTTKTVLIDQFYEFQFLEQGIKLRLIIRPHDGILGFKINGCFAADGGQVVGKISILTIILQFFPEFGTDGGIVQIFVYPVQAAEFQQQVCGGLGSNAGHTGNIIRRVAHEGFEIHHFLRLEAVLGLKHLLGVKGGGGLARFGNDKFYMDIFVDQLQAVTVTGDDDTFPAVIGTNAAHGADHIVGFPTLALVDGDIHGPKNILHYRHLHSQFFRHAVTGGLIAIIL